MSKEHPSQLELFSAGDDARHLAAKPVDAGLLDYIKLYEKTVLIVIGFVITGIVAFCLGVENGKSRAVSSLNSRFDVAGQNDIEIPRAFTKKELPRTILPRDGDSDAGFLIKGDLKNTPVKQEIILRQAPAVGSENGSFTIQIASYQARSGAEKEMAKLRQKGLQPLVLKKGGYNVVCVGTFNNKETARSLLSQLKSKYRDCYIRRL